MTDATATERSERVEELTQKVRELEELIIELGRESADATLEVWKARIDALKVQADLGRMDLRDDTAGPLDAAEAAWSGARARMESLTSEATDVGTALIEGLRSARSELQAAVSLAQARIEAGISHG